MKTLCSTNDVHPRERFDYWHSLACENLVGHDSTPQCRPTFEAELQAGCLAEIGLVLFENSPMAISHTARHVAHTSPDELFLCRQVAGALALEQDSRDLVLEPGDMTLLDPRLPYAGRFFAGSRLLVLKLPRHQLDARIGKTRELTARAIRPTAGENGLLSAFVAMLPSHAGQLAPEAEESVENQVLDLIAVSLSKTMQREGLRVSSARSLILTKLRAAIDAHLTDPNLDANTIAAAAGVSVRYANAVLAEERTSIMRLVQARRLARCRASLEDPSQRHRTVSEIAYSWGFSDMTHFGRKFRAAYKVTPSEYRNARPLPRVR
jgi:AraC family transcriptional activator of tynA and feaB